MLMACRAGTNMHVHAASFNVMHDYSKLVSIKMRDKRLVKAESYVKGSGNYTERSSLTGLVFSIASICLYLQNIYKMGNK